jgi:hypothetical protein
VLHTWPLASAPGLWARVDNADTALNAWAIAWVGMALVTQPLGLFDANIFYPEPRTLAFSEVMLPQAVLGAPLTWAGWDPVLVYNLLVLAGMTLSGWAMAWLVSTWTGDRAAGLVAGLAYAFNAHVLVRFGHLQAQHVQYLPLAFLALDHVLRAPRWRGALLLAAAAVAQALTSNYLLVMTLIAMATALAVRPEAWRPAQARALLVTAATSAAALAPFLLPYWLAHTEQGLTRTFADVAMYSATWRDWLSTGGVVHHGLWSEALGAGASSALFPGVTVTLLALAAVARGQAWTDPRARMVLAAGLAGAVLSFGAHLPGYRWLFEALPVLKGIRVVSRFGWLALLALPVLAGFTLAAWRARLGPRRAAVATIIVAALVTIEALRAPMAFVVYEGIPRIYDHVAAADDIVLVELPFPPREAVHENGPSVLNAAWHLKPLVNGYSGFTPASYDDHARLIAGFPSAATLAGLRRLGVTHVLVHKRRVPAALQERAAVAPGLQLVADEADQRLYRLREDTP